MMNDVLKKNDISLTDNLKDATPKNTMVHSLTISKMLLQKHNNSLTKNATPKKFWYITLCILYLILLLYWLRKMQVQQYDLSDDESLALTKEFQMDIDNQPGYLYSDPAALIPDVRKLLGEMEISDDQILQALQNVKTNHGPEISTVNSERQEIFGLRAFDPDVDKAFEEVYDLQVTIRDIPVASMFFFTDQFSTWEEEDDDGKQVYFMREIISTPSFLAFKLICQEPKLSIIDAYMTYIETMTSGVGILASDPIGAMAHVLVSRHGFTVDTKNELSLPEGDMYPYHVKVNPTHYKFIN